MPTDDDLRRIHDAAADADMMAAGGRHYDAYDGTWDAGLRAVWQAGFEAGRKDDGE